MMIILLMGNVGSWFCHFEKIKCFNILGFYNIVDTVEEAIAWLTQEQTV